VKEHPGAGRSGHGVTRRELRSARSASSPHPFEQPVFSRHGVLAIEVAKQGHVHLRGFDRAALVRQTLAPLNTLALLLVSAPPARIARWRSKAEGRLG
jgi:hypothetical protein